MNALVTLDGSAAPLFEADVNTDTIAPLYRESKGGAAKAGERTQDELAHNLFRNRRFDDAGNELPFILNQRPFRNAQFLIGGPNFACGSSRETAATMLAAFGIRCVIAPSIAGIFFDNCFRNGMLPLTLEQGVVEDLARQAANGAAFKLDIASGILTPPQSAPIAFTLPAFRREALLTGADEIAVTLTRSADIAAYRTHVRCERPWEVSL
jgi:3-isopropylmalate/(R)-2-methylmalate dehydratase small subunit